MTTFDSSKMKTVERVLETEPINGYIYRFHIHGIKTLVRRSPVDVLGVLWHHGVITEIYNRDTNKFQPSCASGGNVWFDCFEDARIAMEGLNQNEQT